MGYTSLVFTLLPAGGYQQDLLIDALAGIGFDTFEENTTGFTAYISSSAFERNTVELVVEKFRQEGLVCSFVINTIAPQNWNEIWESNFEPLLIDEKCYVRATFHAPRKEYPFEIVIDPKMAFGTGHHHTTSLMISYLLEEQLQGKRVLDMGCGTGILAILAAKAGAAEVTAIDNDPVCYESAVENSKLNGVTGIRCICGSSESIPPGEYNVIAANINRNILLDHINAYVKVLSPGGALLLSGFYEHPDLDMLVLKLAESGLFLANFKRSGEWIAARFTSSINF